MNKCGIAKKDLVCAGELGREEIFELIEAAGKLKKKPLSKRRALKNKTLALLFQKPSNRTRISFEVGMKQLGGHAMYLSPQEIDMGVREPVKDVACVLSRYVDVIVARVYKHEDILTLAHYSTVPVINGLSDFCHPCQALADIFTIKERCKNLKRAHLAYVGDGNNVCNSLLMVAAFTGTKMTVSTPKGYEPNKEVFEKAVNIAKRNASSVEYFVDPAMAAKGANFIYTDVWTSMGQESEREKRLKDFQGFQINETLMGFAEKDALIMHCLPAHRGEEVSDIVDGKNSIIYDQAENRMHMQKAILLKLMCE
ncbi:MAG: ornithine carbamoyltransferase [Candidatus Omnitrophica bacterium]|nr:ornithine carbamoyltransferase [Candidatus Omnitrophota bacterium]